MVIKECVARATEILKNAGIDTCVLDARVLACNTLGKDDIYIAVNGDKAVSKNDEERFFALVGRRALYEPVAYITGEKEFMSLMFFVDKNVLIPRPDTEHLAELTIELIEKNGFSTAADFCTGSGAIAVSVAKACENVAMTGIDISPEALGVAERNRVRHKAENVRFMQADILKPADVGKYDIAVSNPPYISGEEMKRLDKTVDEYEPHIALYGGEDGLDFYRRITENAPRFLNGGGVLAFEVGHTQARAVAELMKKEFADINIRKDYGGIERVVFGTLRR